MPLRIRPDQHGAQHGARVRRRHHPSDASPAYAVPAYIRVPYHRRRYTEVWLGEPLSRIRVPATTSPARRRH